jgi:hypothetical protein
MRVAGVDGTKGGWVAITLEAGRFAGDHLLPVDTDSPFCATLRWSPSTSRSDWGPGLRIWPRAHFYAAQRARCSARPRGSFSKRRSALDLESRRKRMRWGDASFI